MRLLCYRLQHRITVWRLFAVLCAATVLYNECIVYWLKTLEWPIIKKSEEDSVTLLLVADPQIVGYDGENALVGPVTRWDNYHYLWVTYWLAYSHVQPDTVLFLGDLIDEGSTSLDSVYRTYVSTFRSIYGRTRKNVYIHGDNDVGGEGYDPRTAHKLERFSRMFSATPSVTRVDFLNIIQFDDELHDINTDTLQHISRDLTQPITILLNHRNVLNQNKNAVKKIVGSFHPQLIITSHIHTAHLLTCRRCLSDRPEITYNHLHHLHHSIHLNITSNTAGFHSNTHNDHQFRAKRDVTERGRHGDSGQSPDDSSLYEIVVPTCSYRMGVPNMGFGVATVTKSGHVTYSILWLPRRLILLKLYLVPVTALVLILIWKGCSRLAKHQRPDRYRYSH